MDLTIIVFLLGGLFLGWSLGANDAANVFGTAVGTRMVQFKTAALVCSVFVILGAIISGAGTTETLGKLGAINALPGAFAACVAAGLSVYIMTKFGLPVSTTQAIVGAIVGWNIYTGSSINIKILFIILSTWVLCPIIAALIAMFFFILTKQILKKTAEFIKIKLSLSPETDYSLDFSKKSMSFSGVFKLEEFESLIAPMLEQTLESCRHVLREAKLSVKKIDEVVLVGGSTVIPAVRKQIESFFGHPPHVAIDPYKVVAIGAGIQGHLLAGGRRDFLPPMFPYCPVLP